MNGWEAHTRTIGLAEPIESGKTVRVKLLRPYPVNAAVNGLGSAYIKDKRLGHDRLEASGQHAPLLFLSYDFD